MGVILPGVERDFPPVFSWDWDGNTLISSRPNPTKKLEENPESRIPKL